MGIQADRTKLDDRSRKLDRGEVKAMLRGSGDKTQGPDGVDTQTAEELRGELEAMLQKSRAAGFTEVSHFLAVALAALDEEDDEADVPRDLQRPMM